MAQAGRRHGRREPALAALGDGERRRVTDWSCDQAGGIADEGSAEATSDFPEPLGWITDPIWCLWHHSPAHMLGSFLTAPPLALGVRYWRHGRRVSRARFGEATLLTATLVVSAAWGFGRRAAIELPALVYLPLPFLLWAALRFGVAGTGASLLFLALVAFGNAIHTKQW